MFTGSQHALSVQQAVATAQAAAQLAAAQMALQNIPTSAASPTVTTTPPVLGPGGPNAAAAQQAQSILAAVQAHQALHQQQRLNPFMTPNVSQTEFSGAKASAQQAISAAEKMYRDALQARSSAATNPSDLLKHLNLLRGQK